MPADQDPTGVLVLYNESSSLMLGEPRDMLAEQAVLACAQVVASALAGGRQVRSVPIRSVVEAALAPFSPSEWLVFNLGEGLDGRLFEEARIAWAIEAMGFCFTGSGGDAIALSIDKALAKEHFVRAGLPMPPWRVQRDPSDSLDGVTLPAIVKPVAEDASLGIGPEAVVHTLDALHDRVAYVLETYRQAALVEPFIVGRELNVSIWGDPPEVLPLAEIDFRDFDDPYERIVSFDAKWERDSFAYNHTPVMCPAPLDRRLAARIREIALGAWETIGCRGYARVDMRVSEAGEPFVIEVNCNPDLSPEAGFYRATQAAGYDYAGMVHRILRTAR